MKTVLEVLTLSTKFLTEKGIANARREAEEVISDALDIKRIQLYLQFDRPMTDAETDVCRKVLTRRASGEPAQYIRGTVEFLDCILKVTPSVLIPRQETEILAAMIVKTLEQEDLSGKAFWDICTGSGCLGIAIKKKFPELSVTLSDLSPDALKIAKENAKANNVEVNFLEGDLLTPFANQKTDYFVCNPPYIPQNEYETLSPEVQQHEPKMALLGGDTGLEFYERLAQELPEYLNPGAKGWLEIGYNQGEDVAKLFSCEANVLPDWAGHDRFVALS